MLTDQTHYTNKTLINFTILLLTPTSSLDWTSMRSFTASSFYCMDGHKPLCTRSASTYMGSFICLSFFGCFYWSLTLFSTIFLCMQLRKDASLQLSNQYIQSSQFCFFRRGPLRSKLYQHHYLLMNVFCCYDSTSSSWICLLVLVIHFPSIAVPSGCFDTSSNSSRLWKYSP